MSIAQLQQRSLILFDLDGTLVDSAADLYRAMNLSLAQLDLPSVTEAQVRVWVGKGAAKLCETVLMHLFGQVDTQQQQQLLSTFVDVYAQQLCVHTQVYAGVLPFLDYCQAQQHDCCGHAQADRRRRHQLVRLHRHDSSRNHG